MRRFLCAGMLVALMATFVQASILDSFVRFGTALNPVTNTVEDRNAEVIRFGPGHVDTSKFEQGDMIDIYLDMVSINSSDGFFFQTFLDGPSAGGPGYNLIGKGTLTISAINNVAGPVGNTTGDFSFTGGIKFYESATGIDFTQGIAAADAVILAAAPSIFEIGTGGDANDFILAVGAPIEFVNIPTSGTAVNADFGLSLLSGSIANLLQDGILDINGVAQDFVGSTQAFADQGLPAGGIGDDTFDLRTNTDFSWNAAPEPAALLVWGGLIALVGGWSFRRRS